MYKLLEVNLFELQRNVDESMALCIIIIIKSSALVLVYLLK